MPVYSFDGVAPELPSGGDYWIAPSAHVMGRVTLKKDASIWWGAVLRGDNDPITIGERTNIQDNSVLHTDVGCPLTIGAGVTVGHKAMLHGCTIGDNTLIGIGATVLNNTVIGKNCLVGAHALIPEGKVIPDNSMVLGAPGKVVKELSAEMIKTLEKSAEVYVSNYKRFRSQLVEISA